MSDRDADSVGEQLVSPALQHDIEQWYYREARMLDGRQYQTWLALCAPEIRYIVPGRSNPLVDNAARGNEDMLGIDHELEGHESDRLPIRDESLPYLMLRVERSFKANAWAENPPARTRRIVGNVEIAEHEKGQFSVLSSFHLHYVRPGGGTFLYAGQRRDVLRRSEDSASSGYLLVRREIVLDMADIEFPTLELFF